MRGAADHETIFDPWYDYLSRLERLVLAVVALAMGLLLAAGVTSPKTDLGAAVGATLFLSGVLTFTVRWSVSDERSTRLASFDDE